MNEPKISVIIPLYNAEKYIRECLLSVLASKFQDYELLVVDDCSTDNSLAEVKKLSPYFDGRLKIFSTEKNSGGPGLPRTVGIKNASGKYVTFIDNDDMILPDALGIFFETAELYGAEVLHTEKWFIFNKEFNSKNLILDFQGALPGKFVDEPTFEPVDLNYRMQHLMTGKFYCLPWGKFFRRDFLIKNKIDFPAQMQYGEDFVFFFKCLCLAKKYILVPYLTNIHRVGIPSASNSVSGFREIIQSWLKILYLKIGILDEFMRKLEFFKANPVVHFDVLKWTIDLEFSFLKIARNPHEVQSILIEELQNPELNTHGKNFVNACLYNERILNK